MILKVISSIFLLILNQGDLNRYTTQIPFIFVPLQTKEESAIGSFKNQLRRESAAVDILESNFKEFQLEVLKRNTMEGIDTDTLLVGTQELE